MLRTKRYLVCLECGDGEFLVEHLCATGRREKWGPWYCDACGAGHRGHVRGDSVHAELTGSRRDRTSVLLRVDPGEGSHLYVVVSGMRFDGAPAVFHHDDNDRYLYEEHSCPENALRAAQAVLLVNGSGDIDSDPHGVLAYIGTAPDCCALLQEVKGAT
jgi:hypothetical protein